MPPRPGAAAHISRPAASRIPLPTADTEKIATLRPITLSIAGRAAAAPSSPAPACLSPAISSVASVSASPSSW